MRPERPFPFIHGPPRARVDAKPDPAVFRVIRPIAVLTGPAHQNRPVLGHMFPQLGAAKIDAGPSLIVSSYATSTYDTGPMAQLFP